MVISQQRADKGEGLLLVRGNRIPIQVVASKAEYRLATTNPRDLDELAAAAVKPPAGNGANHGLSVGATLAVRRSTTMRAPDANGSRYAAE